jgi:hypothetical protein
MKNKKILFYILNFLYPLILIIFFKIFGDGNSFIFIGGLLVIVFGYFYLKNKLKV